MITGQFVKFTKHCLPEFGEYFRIIEDRDNSMDSRTLKALALRPTGNSQGGYYFLNIHTSYVITHFTWTALLLPTSIRKLFRRLARRSPITLEVLDRLDHEVPDADPEDDQEDEYYFTGEYEDNNNDDDDDEN